MFPDDHEKGQRIPGKFSRGPAKEKRPVGRPRKSPPVKRSGRRVKPAPVTRSKGGWRRKPRRITPATIANYWPPERLIILRERWPTYDLVWEILDKLNRVEAPKPTTVWQVRLMASRMKMRRPADIASVNKRAALLGVHNARPFQARKQAEQPEPERRFNKVGCLIEPKSRLRKVGRKKNPVLEKQLAKRRHTIGLSNVFRSLAQARVGTAKRARRRKTAERNKDIRTRCRAGETRMDLAIAHGLTYGTIVKICAGIDMAAVKARKKRQAAYSVIWQRKNHVQRYAKAAAKRREAAAKRPPGRPRRAPATPEAPGSPLFAL